MVDHLWKRLIEEFCSHRTSQTKISMKVLILLKQFKYSMALKQENFPAWKSWPLTLLSYPISIVGLPDRTETCTFGSLLVAV